MTAFLVPYWSSCKAAATSSGDRGMLCELSLPSATESPLPLTVAMMMAVGRFLMVRAWVSAASRSEKLCPSMHRVAQPNASQRLSSGRTALIASV